MRTSVVSCGASTSTPAAAATVDQVMFNHGGRKSAFSHDQEVVLCKMVSGYPCLYNPKDDKFKDIAERDRIWDEIGTTMNEPGDLCKKRWRNIRDTFRKQRRERLVKGGPKQTRWILSDHLGFLEDVENDREGAGPTTNAEPPEEIECNADVVMSYEIEHESYVDDVKQEEEEEEEEEDEQQNTIKEVDDTRSKSPTTSARQDTHTQPTFTTTMILKRNQQKRQIQDKRRGLPPKRPKLQIKEEVNNILEQRLMSSKRDDAVAAWKNEKGQPYEKSSGKEDETDLFFRSMALTTKRLHPLLRIELKRKVCNLVTEFEIRNSQLDLIRRGRCNSSSNQSTSSSPSNSPVHTT